MQTTLSLCGLLIILSPCSQRCDAQSTLPLRFKNATRLSAPINLATSWDSTPCMSADGLEFYFTSQRSGWGTYLAKRHNKSATFLTPEKLKNAGSHGSLSFDGLELFVNRDTENRNADIFVLTRQSLKDEWSKSRRLSENINSQKFERWANISPDGLELYFTRSDKFSEGEFTIWVAKRSRRDSEFGKAMLLPKNINDGQANAACLSPDGLHLFFVSDREGGFGGSDIWIASRRNHHSPWGDPVNPGASVNTDASEWQPTMTFDGRKLLFSRNPNKIDWENLESEIWETDVVGK